MSSADGLPIHTIGVVLHPKRDVSRTVDALREWACARDAALVQLSRLSDGPHIAPDGDARDCALVVAIGGDGTVLAALREASAVQRPVLGIACGSLGALTTVEGEALVEALEAFAAGDWEPKSIPALSVTDAAGATASAINDLVVVRDGGNQVSVEAEADGVLYGRWSGDGVIASTALGSSAYALAAGGPILAPGAGGWSITPLAAHGGCVPPLVLGARATGRLVISPGFAGARVEIDGQRAPLDPRTLTIVRRSGFGTLISVGDEEPLLTGLRRRRIVMDSPRVLARDARLAKARADG